MALKSILTVCCFLTFAFSATQAQSNCDTEMKTIAPGAKRVSVPLERFAKPIEALNQSLESSKSLDESIATLVKTDGRGTIFQIEGLLKIYSEIFPETLKPWKEKVKSLEDAFGQYTEKVEYFDGAKNLKEVPKQVLAVLEKPITTTANALRKTLLSGGWLTKDGKMGPTWDKLREDLKTQDWGTKEEDGDLFAEVVIDQMKEVRDKLDANEYSPYKLQEGVHELRRKLRWFLIYFQAGNGLFKLIMPRIGMDLKDYVYLVNEPIAKSKFSKLPENKRIEDPYTLPFHYFLALSMKVQEIGAVKSNAELFETIKKGFIESGLSKNTSEAEEKVSAIFKANSLPVTYASKAESLMNEMVNSEMLWIIRKWLKVQLKGGDPLEN